MFKNRQQVFHPHFGIGQVLADQGDTVIVRFETGIESCAATDLAARLAVADAAEQGECSPLLEVTLKAQAAAIRSLNDAWGVFSRSRIDLLPHQLWVCHKALQQWPIQLLIADDVGMGKTIEAGLILWPLIASGRARRILILAPAALVTQWQDRLRTMFDIRMSVYRPEAERRGADFWSTNDQVVASLHTLRLDRSGRHDRIMEAPAWDMLIVDEAHHLNAEEHTGKTLGYKLVERLIKEGRVSSRLFFTGTPHRGKPYGFWALMKLLRPDDFDPRRPEREQLPLLAGALIRNRKQQVVDMTGNKLFTPVSNHPYTYDYTDAESAFYEKLTDFIVAGNAYASSLQQDEQRQVALVLISIQKIASSSVAAIRAALTKRLLRLRSEASELAEHETVDAFKSEEDEDEVAAVLKKWMGGQGLRLLAQPGKELVHLEELLASAAPIGEESKIARINKIIDSEYRSRSILLFTEYKATQAMMVATLMARFGENCVGFINGDDRLEGVRLPSGQMRPLTAGRELTAERFNNGQIRFLVSTEAAGEGIDLQHRCHTLIHIDLPWNPMRLHQRVGRLSRYGQQHPVDVVTIRNPNTVESRIWEKLEIKISSIMDALGHAMGEPEDLMQMVLGMARPELFNELFAQGQLVQADRFDEWFDAKTGKLGGKSALATIKELVGHCQSFDLSQLAEVPKMDLKDLKPFFNAALTWNHRRPSWQDDRLSFKTPDAWSGQPGIRSRYENLIFHRLPSDKDETKKIVGVGLKVLDQALREALEFNGVLSLLQGGLPPLAVFQVQDAVTTESGHVHRTAAGVTADKAGKLVLLRDEQLLAELNRYEPSAETQTGQHKSDGNPALSWLKCARGHLQQEIGKLRLPFKKPLINDLALFWNEGEST